MIRPLSCEARSARFPLGSVASEVMGAVQTDVLLVPERAFQDSLAAA